MSMLIIGCSEEQQQENCLKGTWFAESNICQTNRQLKFNSNGTGSVYLGNCVDGCANNAEWRERIDFNYQVTEAGITQTEHIVYRCDTVFGSSNQPVTVEFNCDGNVLIYGAITYIKQ